MKNLFTICAIALLSSAALAQTFSIDVSYSGKDLTFGKLLKFGTVKQVLGKYDVPVFTYAGISAGGHSEALVGPGHTWTWAEGSTITSCIGWHIRQGEKSRLGITFSAAVRVNP